MVWIHHSSVTLWQKLESQESIFGGLECNRESCSGGQTKQSCDEGVERLNFHLKISEQSHTTTKNNGYQPYSYILRLLWCAWCKNRHPPTSAHACSPIFVIVRVEGAQSVHALPRVWIEQCFDLFYCRKHWFTATFQTERFLILFNNNNNNKKDP